MIVSLGLVYRVATSMVLLSILLENGLKILMIFFNCIIDLIKYIGLNQRRR